MQVYHELESEPGLMAQGASVVEPVYYAVPVQQQQPPVYYAAQPTYGQPMAQPPPPVYYAAPPQQQYTDKY